MKPMTAEVAFGAYEAVRHRLPDAPSGVRVSRHAKTLADIADDFDVFLLDAFGVLNIGETAIPGACERVRDLRAAGKQVMVVSNAASLPVADLVQKYQRLGYPFEADDVVTSRATMGASMNRYSAQSWGVMVPEGADLRDLGNLEWSPLEDDPAPYDAVDGIMLVGSGSWSEERQNLLEAALNRKARPVLVANPDIVAPRENGFTREPGYFAHRLADRTGVEPVFFGKPFASIFEIALARLGVTDRSRVVMVGDSLHTDILGAQAAGLTAALIADFGFFADMDARNAMKKAGIYPDIIVDRP
ncbi:TIGR01459 family HAD-type hydrolase [Marivita geojedonensis]|uniref:HAD family hydrolase n=1 Tax=Marivita geojedonensis TaxID=1123756 RepID=A0A1X4NHT3_9RHOB|nr:TIGR01459 family HAD-type hydrolase [Marivita geojedonensis]OSQ47568.1 HAD family hydrolase [Marivita geojedonensis]PRY74556.1 HAD superfamily hydrolase (TIGR01459 family) [Marivita geojedonensis]